jgi:hypothetical protein
MKRDLEILPVDIDGEKVLVVVRLSGGEEQVAWRALSFGQVTRSIEAIASEFTKVFRKLKPDKASLEFNISLTLEASDLAAVFFDASGSGGLKIALEWGPSQGDPPGGG